MNLSEGFKAENLELAIKDCEILAEILKKHPEDMYQILTAIGNGKLEDAKKVAMKIGITRSTSKVKVEDFCG